MRRFVDVHAGHEDQEEGVVDLGRHLPVQPGEGGAADPARAGSARATRRSVDPEAGAEHGRVSGQGRDDLLARNLYVDPLH